MKNLIIFMLFISNITFAQTVGSTGTGGPDGDPESFGELLCKKNDEAIKELQHEIIKLYENNAKDSTTTDFDGVILKLSTVATLNVIQELADKDKLSITPPKGECHKKDKIIVSFSKDEFEQLKDNMSSLHDKRITLANCHNYNEEVLKEIQEDTKIIKTLKELYEKYE